MSILSLYLAWVLRGIDRIVFYFLLETSSSISFQFSSVQLLRHVRLFVTHGLQHARLPCPSLTPGTCSNSCPLSGDAIQLSHHPLSSPSPSAFNLSQRQDFFPMSQFFASGDQSIASSASVSVLPMNVQGWFHLGLNGFISLQSKWLSRVFSNTTVKSINSSVLSILQSPTLTSIHDYWKTIALTRQTFVGKVMSLLFNMLSSLVISSVQSLVMSNSLQPLGLQHARLPCPSPIPGAYTTHVHWVSDAIQLS